MFFSYPRVKWKWANSFLPHLFTSQLLNLVLMIPESLCACSCQEVSMWRLCTHLLPVTFMSSSDKHVGSSLIMQVVTSWKPICCSIYWRQGEGYNGAVLWSIYSDNQSLIFIWWSTSKRWLHHHFRENKMRMRYMYIPSRIFLCSEGK